MTKGACSCIALISVLAAAGASTGPCGSSATQTAFLRGIVDGLPDSAQDALCSGDPNSLLISPDQTGVVHYVLPGFIPKHMLGEENGSWKTLASDHSYTDPFGSEAAVLHLWLRALCVE